MRSAGQKQERLLEELERLLEELERLRRQNAELMLYKHALDQLPVCTTLYDHTGKVKYRNRAAKDVDGYDNWELVGLTREEYLRRLIATNRGRSKVMISPPAADSLYNGIYELDEATLIARGGVNKQVLLAGSFVYNNEDYLLGTCDCTFDVSPYARQNSAHVLQRLMDIIFIPVFHKDARGFYKSCNAAFEKLTGLSRSKIIGKSVFDLYPRDLAEKYHEMDTKLFKNPGIQVYETNVPSANGTRHDAILTKSTYLNAEGEVAGLVGVITDRSEHKRVEKELSFSKEKFMKIFDASPGSMAIMTRDGRITEANRSFIISSCYSTDEVIGKNVKELNVFANPEEHYAIISILNSDGIVTNREVGFRNKFGEPGVGLLSAEMIELDGEECILAVVIDITERKRLEREMARLDRMNLVGQMAAGIGHEIRNPLTAVRGFLQLLTGKEECSLYEEYLNIAISELDRANAIITEFLSLARDRPLHLQKRNINDIIKVLFPLMHADATISGKHIEMLLGEIPKMPIDEKEIRQLILNLVRNGMEAMPKGGRMQVKTYQDGNAVVLAVKDEGFGIKSAILERLGTPFLTTKDEGTGLGLAVCYSIAGRHNATIDIKTSPSGTTFYVRFGK